MAQFPDIYMADMIIQTPVFNHPNIKINICILLGESIADIVEFLYCTNNSHAFPDTVSLI